MGKVDFSKLARQPKYMVPIIVLPFAIGIICILMLGDNDAPVKSAAEVVIDLPDAVSESEQSKAELVEKQILEEEARRQAYDDSIYALNEARRKDSLARASVIRQQKNMERVNRRTSASSRQGGSGRSSSRNNGGEELSEFEKFKAEMEMLDRLANPDQTAKQKPVITDPQIQEPEAKTVTKAKGVESEYFTTIRDRRQPSHIHAMVDEVVKGKQGSRVRIRLLDDIEVDGYKLAKGNYLYSFISGFGEMRVYLTIKNIMVEDQIIPVKLEVYDLDANPGLYVPKSNFVAMVQQSGSQLTGAMRVSVDQNQDSRLAELGYNMMDQLLSIGTRTAGQNLSKNKARIKYNTHVILVNSANK